MGERTAWPSAGTEPAHGVVTRTSLYATYARLDNDGAAAYAVATPPTMTAGATSTGYEVGIRHRF